MQQTFDLPNPEAWMSVEQAIAVLKVSRAGLYDMIADGRLGDYRIGAMRVLWASEVRTVADALKLVRPRRG